MYLPTYYTIFPFLSDLVFKPDKYDKQRFCSRMEVAWSTVESIGVSTLHKSIEKNTPIFCNLSIFPYRLILTLF